MARGNDAARGPPCAARRGTPRKTAEAAIEAARHEDDTHEISHWLVSYLDIILSAQESDRSDDGNDHAAKQHPYCFIGR